MRQKIIYVLTVILCVLLLVAGRKFATANPSVENVGTVQVSEKVKVVKVLDPEYEKTAFPDDWEMRGESIVLLRRIYGRIQKGRNRNYDSARGQPLCR